ncbi:Putative replication protein rep [Streptococcus gallolyticus]|uniref:Putative replication protein rep n=1 Tax=Streptococcus gallolyticus TaxID=315405 RepID=A0A060RFN3_9STRE|nr:replication initiation protein [Streptococcus gallolyticus]CBZ49483.1 putative replication protein rep [Streptococcus gallolyticus subsp. gallolyticus ATCC BAA-2069]CDO17169.1 Putative replication protein rep [Streptococcus gallolyticus]
MNEIVRYNNDLNGLKMRKWTAEEMNFFFSVIAKVRDKGTRLVIFNSDELKELSGFANRHKQRWEDVIDSVATKVADLKYYERTEQRILIMNLFAYFEADIINKTIEVEVSSKFEYVVNKLLTNFTQYELEEFTNIRSTYAKTLYRLLKQWRTVGKKEFEINEFKEILDTPSSYRPSEIKRLILNPTLKQLSPYFKDLKIKTIKSNKRGNPVLGYEFTWKPEKTGEWEDNKYKKNDFYKPKKVESNVPNWVEKEYKHSATAEEQAKLEELRRSMFED